MHVINNNSNTASNENNINNNHSFKFKEHWFCNSNEPSNIQISIIIITGYAISTNNPMTLATLVLIASVISAAIVFNSSASSWLSFVLILTFASGMITLFIYTTSFTPNPNTNTNNHLIILSTLLVTISSPTSPVNEVNESINTFSSNSMLMVMIAVLILTMISVSNQGHHPNQTISTSF